MDTETTTAPTIIAQPGLSWELSATPFSAQPLWRIEPNVDVIHSIARRELELTGDISLTVEALADGSVNKAYIMKCFSKDNVEETYILRVALPVHPRLRTLSEKSTIDYVRENTHLPVPKVIKYDASFDNELGFEWMIMEYVPGKTLAEHGWHESNWAQKEILVRKIIQYLSVMFRKQFDQIGSLYASNELTGPAEHDKVTRDHVDENEYHLGEIVSFPFWRYERLTHNTNRGPFKSSREWLTARLQLYIDDSDRILEDAVAHLDDVVAAKEIKPLAIRLLALLPKVFPETKGNEVFVLHNHDMHISNILVDSEGNLSGVIDWECIHTVPLWYACQLPEFLRGNTRHKAPWKDEMTDGGKQRLYWMLNDDTGEMEFDDIYWEHLLEYEQTRLRVFFFEEMERVLPEWIKIYRESEMKADFELAVANCQGNVVENWIVAVEQDKVPIKLKDTMRNFRYYDNGERRETPWLVPELHLWQG